MSRRVVKKLAQALQARRHEWYLRVFGDRLTDAHLWSLNRHAITTAFGVGIGLSFVPLPVHLPLVVLVAIWWRLNLPVAVAAVYVNNPFTMVPIYYSAYRLGAWLLRYRPRHFEFRLSWQWLEHGLGPAWKPFLLGCLVCGVLGGILARFGLEQFWRTATIRRFRARQARMKERIRARLGAHKVAD